MGHNCTVLTFPEKMSNKEIRKNCARWATCNCDLEERGGYGFDDFDVNFTNKIFEDYDEAEEYLEDTFGHYRQIAVRYKKYPKVEKSKTELDLERRIEEYSTRICQIDCIPHYANTSYATIKCKHCGSALSTAYCGKTFNNTCPVCREDLRPESVLKKKESYQATVMELQKKLKAEVKRQNLKIASKVEYMWAVACEVHC